MKNTITVPLHSLGLPLLPFPKIIKNDNTAWTLNHWLWSKKLIIWKFWSTYLLRLMESKILLLPLPKSTKLSQSLNHQSQSKKVNNRPPTSWDLPVFYSYGHILPLLKTTKIEFSQRATKVRFFTPWCFEIFSSSPKRGIRWIINVISLSLSYSMLN